MNSGDHSQNSPSRVSLESAMEHALHRRVIARVAESGDGRVAEAGITTQNFRYVPRAIPRRPLRGVYVPPLTGLRFEYKPPLREEPLPMPPPSPPKFGEEPPPTRFGQIWINSEALEGEEPLARAMRIAEALNAELEASIETLTTQIAQLDQTLTSSAAPQESENPADPSSAALWAERELLMEKRQQHVNEKALLMIEVAAAPLGGIYAGFSTLRLAQFAAQYVPFLSKVMTPPPEPPHYPYLSESAPQIFPPHEPPAPQEKGAKSAPSEKVLERPPLGRNYDYY